MARVAKFELEVVRLHRYRATAIIRKNNFQKGTKKNQCQKKGPWWRKERFIKLPTKKHVKKKKTQVGLEVGGSTIINLKSKKEGLTKTKWAQKRCDGTNQTKRQGKPMSRLWLGE